MLASETKWRKTTVILPEEEFLSLTDAAAFSARNYGGRRPSTNTMARWCIHGMRGVRLESIKRGGHRVTTKSALHRFFRRLSGDDGFGGAVSNPRTPSGPIPMAVLADNEAARQELIAKGF